MIKIDTWTFRNPPTLWQRCGLWCVGLGLAMIAVRPWSVITAYRLFGLYRLGAWTLKAHATHTTTGAAHD